MELNLSYNNISHIEGLDNLICLKRLDLSFNEISKIGQSLSNITSLSWLNLKANRISDIEEIGELCYLTELKSLFFQDSKNSNPVCQNPQYHVKLISSKIPSLTCLDGSHILVWNAFHDLENKIKSDEEAEANNFSLDGISIEPWYSKDDLEIST